MTGSNTFYVRWRGRIEGPIARAELVRRMQIGELGRYDEFSTDKSNWRFLKDFDPPRPAATDGKTLNLKPAAQQSPPSNAATQLRAPGNDSVHPPIPAPNAQRDQQPSVSYGPPVARQPKGPPTGPTSQGLSVLQKNRRFAEARVGDLLSALAVDVILVTTLFGALSALVVTLSPMSLPELGGLQFAALAIALLYIIWTYWAVQQSSSRQATLGQHLFGLRLRQADGQLISYGLASRRILLATLSLVTGIAVLYWLAVGRQRGLHNQLFRTHITAG